MQLISFMQIFLFSLIYQMLDTWADDNNQYTLMQKLEH